MDYKHGKKRILKFFEIKKLRELAIRGRKNVDKEQNWKDALDQATNEYKTAEGTLDALG